MTVLDFSVLHTDKEMDYLVELWTETETNMPTIKQLRYLLFLCEQKGTDTSFWQRDVLTRRDAGAIINAILKNAR